MPAATSPLGPILRQGRIAAGLTQEYLAALVGVGQTTLSAYERGIAEPTFSTAVAIAMAIGLDLGDLAAPFRQLERAS